MRPNDGRLFKDWTVNILGCINNRPRPFDLLCCPVTTKSTFFAEHQREHMFNIIKKYLSIPGIYIKYQQPAFANKVILDCCELSSNLHFVSCLSRRFGPPLLYLVLGRRLQRGMKPLLVRNGENDSFCIPFPLHMPIEIPRGFLPYRLTLM